MAGKEPSQEVELTVAEAPKSDVGLGRVRVDEASRRRLGVGKDDVVEIVGKRQTLALVFNLMPEDEGMGIARIDGLLRENAQVSPGDKVVIRKAAATPAKEIELAPFIAAGHKMTWGLGIENFVKRGLMNRPLCKGDTVIVPGIALMGGALPFMVRHTKPEGNITVKEGTEVTLRSEPFRRLEALSPEELVQAFVGRITERLSDTLAEFEEELGSLEGETGDEAKTMLKEVQDLLHDLRARKPT